MTISPELYQAIITVVDERVRDIKVTRAAFDALQATVRELAEAQRRTEARLEQLAEAQWRTEGHLEQLAEAQQQSEVRLSRVEAAVERLAEAQQRTEGHLERLAEAQRESEARLSQVEAAVERLAEAQRALAEAQRESEARLSRVEAAVERLAEAQRALAEAQQRTENTLSKLIRSVEALSSEVGKLAEVVGIGLEDIAKIVVPGYLERHHGIRLEGPLGEELHRWTVGAEGREVEFDFYGQGIQDSQRVVVLGEVKSRIYSDDVRGFLKRVMAVEAGLPALPVRVMFGYAIHPIARQEAQNAGVILIASYQR